MVDYHSFLGVFFLEIISVGLFLFAGYRTLNLYGAKRAALLGLPVVAALVLSSVSFQQGDSAEELCLPMLAWSLFTLLQWLRKGAPGRMATGQLLFNGFLGGCVLWVKFTMLGFYAPWLIGIMESHHHNSEEFPVLSTTEQAIAVSGGYDGQNSAVTDVQPVDPVCVQGWAV